MKRIVLLFGLLVPTLCLAQCQHTPYVYDATPDHLMGAKLDGSLAGAIRSLEDQGAEVFVYASGKTDNLDRSVTALVQACPFWNINPGASTFDALAKSTLVILAVSPESRVSGLYYGSAWHHALDGQWNRIRTDYMNPRFRDKDWNGGLTAGMDQLANRVRASKDEALHPNVSQTTYQATDLTGLWKFLLWAIVGLGVFVALGSILGLYFKRKRQKEDQETARDTALQARALVANKLNTLKDAVANRPEQTDWDSVSDLFNRYGSTRLNPDDADLPVKTYETITRDYNGMYNRLMRISNHLSDPNDPPTPSDPERPIEQDDYKARHERRQKHRTAAAGSTAGSTTPTSAPAPSNTSIFAPVIIEGNNTHETSDRDGDSTTETKERHHRDDSDSGGSSSYSAPDPSPSWRSSSSSSDSGGSSSFDTGSFGGGDSGGSSDFGGGGSSDSGGSGGF